MKAGEYVYGVRARWAYPPAPGSLEELQARYRQRRWENGRKALLNLLRARMKQ